MSIQQNFPAISPSLSLNFARSKTLDPRITFTRTSSATRVNGQGLVEVIPANAPRFDHSYDPVSGTVKSLGLLIEEQRQNLLLKSEDFSQIQTGGGNWDTGGGLGNRSSNVTISPDGNLTADKLIEGTSSVAGYTVYQPNTITGTDNLCFSIFAKEAGRRYMTIDIWDGNTIAAGAKFDLQTGTYISSGFTGGGAISVVGYGIIPYPNGWYRCYFSANRSSITYIYARILFGKDDPYAVYTGDGTSGIYVWGAQLERGNFPTSYIPTTLSSTATRTADNASMVGENFSSWYNQSEGTFLLKSAIANPGNGQNQFLIRASNNTYSNAVGIFDPGNGTASISVTVDALFQGLTGSINTIQKNSLFAVSSAYKFNDLALTLNSNLISVDSSAPIPTDLNRFDIGKDHANATANGLDAGTISQIVYYPRRLSNQILQTLTR